MSFTCVMTSISLFNLELPLKHHARKTDKHLLIIKQVHKFSKNTGAR